MLCSRTQVIVFVFIILLIIISISKDVIVGILTVGLLTNFFILFYHICRLTNNCAEDPVRMEGLDDPAQPLIDEGDGSNSGGNSSGTSEDNKEDSKPPTPEYIPPDAAAYGPQYIDYNNIRGRGIDPYKPLTNCRPDDVSFTVDNKNAMSARRRARDKRCKTAVVKKGSDYYKYHFADELKDSENRVWWGRHEY